MCYRLNAKLDGATDRLVYDYVRDHMLDEGEKLPSFATWAKQLRTARSFHGQKKNQPRAARPHGKSIVLQDQV